MKLKSTIFRSTLLLAFYLASQTVLYAGVQPNSKTSSLIEVKSPQKVEVGIWPLSIYNIDPKANTFNASAFVWFKWTGTKDPTKTVDFLNSVDKSNFKKEENTKGSLICTNENGESYNYKCYKIDGKFFHQFDLKRFPLDEQKLEILIEDNNWFREALTYAPDLKDSGMDTRLNIPGWEIVDKRLSLSEVSDVYPTGWGSDAKEHTSSYSLISSSITIKRPWNFFIWKMMLPILMVLIANWTGLLLHPNHLGARITMSGTALLTSVFLSQGYLSNIADTNHLVLMDRIYAAVFIVIIASLVQILIQGALYDQNGKGNYSKTVFIDRVSVIMQGAIFATYLMIEIATT